MPAYVDFLTRLDGLGLFHMDLTLDRMAAFAERHGLPRFPVMHVVGTNGKGSTATILAELLQAHGLRVGLYTSPHFVSVRERILVNGEQLPEDAWARVGARIFAECGDLGLTYFEVLTVLAVLAFEEEGVDVAVMEAGLGGRFDATNVLAPQLTVFTPIGLDHLGVLGDTLEEIAADKAGALRQGGVAVSAPQEPKAWRVLREQAAQVGSELIPAADVLFYSRANGRVQPGPLSSRGKSRFVRPLAGLKLALPGLHQELNARTALAAFHVWAARLRLPVIEDACREAFSRVFIPGRMQFVPPDATSQGGALPELILDGGHNTHGLKALGEALAAEGIRPAAVIFGCLRDKPLADMLPIVRTFTDGPIYACGIPTCERACAPGKLAELLGPGAIPAADVHAALAALAGTKGPVLVCGSLYLLGEFYTTHPGLLERTALQGMPQAPPQTPPIIPPNTPEVSP